MTKLKTKLFAQPDIDLARAVELYRQGETSEDYQTITGHIREGQTNAVESKTSHKP